MKRVLMSITRLLGFKPKVDRKKKDPSIYPMF